jgi:hypothetical protein
LRWFDVPRPSKLTPQQLAEITQRLAAGESRRALAREYGVTEGAIRQRVPTQTTQQVRTAAQKLAEGRLAVASLPTVAEQYTAVSLTDKLVNISRSLASAAELGAATAHRLHALANSEVSKVDDAEPMASLDSLRNVGVLTKLANESSHIALNLLAANRDAVTRLNAEPPAVPSLDASKLSSAALAELLDARADAF